MRAHSPQITLTEFLTKSLVTAGVFLAIPASFSVAVATVVLWIFWSDDAWIYLAWLAYCALGFYLLSSSFRVVRSPDPVRRARLVWLSVSAYFTITIGVGATWLVSTFRLAQSGELRDWRGDELDPAVLTVPGAILVLLLWPLALSTALCIRRNCA